MSLEKYLPDFVRSRYASKLLGVSFLIVLVILSLTTITVIDVSDRVQANQLESVETNAKLEARALGQWIDGKQQVIRALSNHDALSPFDAGRAQSMLTSELGKLSPETASLAVVDRRPDVHSNGTNETILASTETALIGEPLSATDVNWKPTVGFNFDSADDVILSWVYTDANETLVSLASPTQNGEHVLVAEYQTSVRAERFTSALSGTETLVLGGFTAYVLFDEIRTAGFTPYEGDRQNSTIGRAILQADPTAEINGSTLTATEVKGYHSVPGDKVDWVVVKEVPRSTALALTDSVERDLWLLLGLAAGGFLLVGVVIQRGPIRSIKRLANQANAIAEGDLSVEIEEDGRNDEVGEVRSAFANTKEYIETITEQADALSRQAFDDESLDADIPGRVGDAMATMQRDLEHFISRLEVFNRILRHNLRNEVDVINGHAEALEESEQREAILEAARRLESLGTRARRIDRMMSRETRPVPVDLQARIDKVLSDIGTDDVSLTRAVPEGATLVTDEETLTSILRSPIENAVEYTDTTVEISAEPTDTGWTVEIRDDGPGIPDAELDALAAEGEAPLQHSRGLGLWELKWGVDMIDGDLEFEVDAGTTVRLHLPDLDSSGD